MVCSGAGTALSRAKLPYDSYKSLVTLMWGDPWARVPRQGLEFLLIDGFGSGRQGVSVIILIVKFLFLTQEIEQTN